MTTKNIHERIWLIADGHPLKLDNMAIRTTDSGKLLVTGWTNTTHFENISRNLVRQELEDLKDDYNELSKSFSELNEIVKRNNLTIEFHLAYIESGNVSIRLFSEIDGQINWCIDS